LSVKHNLHGARTEKLAIAETTPSLVVIGLLFACLQGFGEGASGRVQPPHTTVPILTGQILVSSDRTTKELLEYPCPNTA
jgi:hypothetical protein